MGVFFYCAEEDTDSHTPVCESANTVKKRIHFLLLYLFYTPCQRFVIYQTLGEGEHGVQDMVEQVFPERVANRRCCNASSELRQNRCC